MDGEVHKNDSTKNPTTQRFYYFALYEHRKKINSDISSAIELSSILIDEYIIEE
jgi:hypothetical protein